MKIYLISGLAADARVFKNLKFPEHVEVVNLDWIPPLRNESLREYALRLAEKIDKSEKFALLGLSMGGMIAVEISKVVSPEKLILISSIPVAKHLPFYFMWAGKIGLHKIIPVSFFRYGSIIKRVFTAESAEDKEILRQVIRDSDPKFVKWAIHAILKWDNDMIPAKYYHIHGSRDEMLPMRFTKPTHIIQKAGHLMVVNRAEEISSLLAELLDHE